MLEVLLLCVGGGSLVGLLNGLLGIGGAFIIIPLLDILLIRLGVPANVSHIMAVGTSPSTILFTCVAGAMAHYKLGSVRVDLLKIMGPCIFLGGVTGAFVAPLVSTAVLKLMFGMIFLSMSVYGVLPQKEFEREGGENIIFLRPVTFIFGMLASMTGVAGTMLNIVYLNWRGVPWAQAVGTGAGIGAIIAFTATVGYIASGWNVAGLPDWSLGYLYLPGLLCLIVPSMIMAKVGAMLVHWKKMPLATMKKVVFCFLVFIGLSIIWNSLKALWA